MVKVSTPTLQMTLKPTVVAQETAQDPQLAGEDSVDDMVRG